MSGAMGSPEGLLACNAPLGVVATATPSRKIKLQAIQFIKLDPTYSNLAFWGAHTGLASGGRLHPKKRGETSAAHTSLALDSLGAATLNVCPS